VIWVEWHGSLLFQAKASDVRMNAGNSLGVWLAI